MVAPQYGDSVFMLDFEEKNVE